MSDLKISSPDFTTIKQSLKDYLKDQTEFTDYNFEGSAINFLLDILAYNSYYNVIHTNLAFSENFLDTAATRGAIVSRAKELGYTPRSKTPAKATITLSFSVSGNPSQYILPKGTNFSATYNGTSYNFTTIENIIFTNNGSNVFSKQIDIYQGIYSSYQYTVNTNDALQRFIIPDKNADTTYLEVSYKTSSSSTTYNNVVYNKNINLGDLSEATDVYFLQETFDGYFEVYFGDDVIGRSVKNGNIIKLDYIITAGKDANNISRFSIGSSISALSNITIVTVTPSSGGDDKETTDSIKYLAPYYYQSQGRAVTEDDMKSLIKNTYGNIDDVMVWGGEKNNPPYYGKVFIALKLKDSTTYLSDSLKESIKSEVQRRFSIVSVRPEIVDPDYLYVSIDVVARYNTKLLTNTTNLETTIQTAIENYFSNTVNKFTKSLYYSKLLNEINTSSASIIDTIVNLKVSKMVEIYSGLSGEYTYSFNNAISKNSVYSDLFLVDGTQWKIKDVPTDNESTGTLSVYRTSGNSIIYLTQNAGTVDYNTGEIIVKNIAIDSIVNDPIYNRLTITVSPGSTIDTANPQSVYYDTNVYTNERDQIISIKDNGITITLIADSTT